MTRETLNEIEPDSQDSLLHTYVREDRQDVVAALLDSVPRFSQLNHVNIVAETALHIACYVGSETSVKRILDCKYFVNIAQRDLHGNTAFHYCAFQGRELLVRAFADFITNVKNNFVRTEPESPRYANCLAAILQESLQPEVTLPEQTSREGSGGRIQF